MKPLHNTFYVRIEKDKNKIEVSGHELYLETRFEEYQHAIQEGIIVETPYYIGDNFKYHTELNIGDKIYFHHFVAQPASVIQYNGETLYQCDYQHIYCKEDNGEILMLEDYFLACAVLEPRENYEKEISGIVISLKPNPDYLPNVARVQTLSLSLENQGLKVGDEVYHVKDANYDLIVNGIKYFCISYKYVRMINAQVRDGYMLVEKDNEYSKEVNGIKVFEFAKRAKWGNVVDDKTGEKFFNGKEFTTTSEGSKALHYTGGVPYGNCMIFSKEEIFAITN